MLKKNVGCTLGMLFSQYIPKLHTGDICLLKMFVLTGKFAPSVCHKMIKFC